MQLRIDDAEMVPAHTLVLVDMSDKELRLPLEDARHRWLSYEKLSRLRRVGAARGRLRDEGCRDSVKS